MSMAKDPGPELSQCRALASDPRKNLKASLLGGMMVSQVTLEISEGKQGCSIFDELLC